jgi:GNAT superfamily N-acetyltransferase
MKVPVENIVELKVEHQFLQAYPLMKQLYANLHLDTFLKFSKNMPYDGYHLFGLYYDTNIVALAGISWRENLHNKRYVFVQDFVTDANHQPHELGYNLLSYIHEWAKEEGAICVMDSYIHVIVEDKQSSIFGAGNPIR